MSDTIRDRYNELLAIAEDGAGYDYARLTADERAELDELTAVMLARINAGQYAR